MTMHREKHLLIHTQLKFKLKLSGLPIAQPEMLKVKGKKIVMEAEER